MVGFLVTASCGRCFVQGREFHADPACREHAEPVEAPAAGSVAPYSPAQTREAAGWLSYLDGIRTAVLADPDATAEDLDNATAEEIDKLQRRGCISEPAAMLLAETFDVAPLMGFGLGAPSASLALA